ncbi:hypothetical protein Tco_1296716 [Tanacetum coccineum]
MVCGICSILPNPNLRWSKGSHLVKKKYYGYLINKVTYVVHLLMFGFSEMTTLPIALQVIPGSVVVTPGSVVVTPGSVVVTTGSVVVTPGSVVVTTGSVVVTTGSILVTPGSYSYSW